MVYSRVAANSLGHVAVAIIKNIAPEGKYERI